jgi:transposase
MRFYTRQHKHYCGIDLHAHTMSLCVRDQAGEVLLEQNVRWNPRLFLRTSAPYRDDLGVAGECIFTGYGLAALRAREQLPFVLGHALSMKAIHGGKAKNDRSDAPKLATLRRGGMIPQADVSPPEMRATRDRVRRRLSLGRKRGQLLAHIQNTHHQPNRPEPSRKILYWSNRARIPDTFTDPSVRKRVAADLAPIDLYDRLLRAVARHIVRTVKEPDPASSLRLRSLPGVGTILALRILYDLHDLRRFPRVHDVASYARLVTGVQASAGKRLGTGGRTIGNAPLPWAFSEAAVLFLRQNPKGPGLFKTLQRTHGTGKALSILAHTLGRATYPRLGRGPAFHMETSRAA